MTLKIQYKNGDTEQKLVLALEEAVAAKKEREPWDDYPTPMSWAVPCASAVLGLVEYEVSHVIEPAAGQGNFIRALKISFPSDVIYHAHELQAKYAPLLQSVASYVTIGDWAKGCIDEADARGPVPGCEPMVLVIGNPPYNLAEEFVLNSFMPLVDGEYVAFLLRVNFLAGKARAKEFYPKAGLKYVLPFDGRPKFRPGKNGKMGSDATEYAMFMFQKGYKGPATIPDGRISQDTAWL
jgi:hypothetical protein